MSEFLTWFVGMLQQAIAILIGGVVAVGWGRQIAERLTEWWEDRGQCVAYIDVPDQSGNESYYYVGSLPLPGPPPIRDGNYRTYREVSDPYKRWHFTPTHPIRSRKELHRALMTTLLTQDDGHILQGHPLRPSQNSWQPGEPLGRFDPVNSRKPALPNEG